jgi:undecaprenyl pyrophosphate phosphatase UppP
MRIDLLALYAGPDQVMTVTSGLASILGVLLIFWHKVVAAVSKIVNKFRGSPATPVATQKNAPPKNS